MYLKKSGFVLLQVNLIGSETVVFRNSFYNLLGLGLPLVVAVVAVPALIHSLGTDRFGVLTLIWAVVSYFGLFDLGLGRAVTQQVAIAISDQRRDRLSAIVGTSSSIMLVLGLIGGMCMLIAAPIFAERLASPGGVDEVRRSFYWMAVAMPAIVLTSGYRGMLEATGKFALVNLIRMPMGVFTFGGPLLAVWGGYTGLDTIAAILAFGRIIACLFHAWFALPIVRDVRLHGHFERKLVRPLLQFGGWLSLMNIFGPLIGYIDRFIVGVVLGPQAAAYFVTPQEVATKISLVPMALSAVLFPSFSTSLTDSNNSVLGNVKKYTLVIAGLTFLPSLAIAVLSHKILALWIGVPFADQTATYLSVFAIGCFINSLAHVPMTLIVARNGSKKASLLYLFEAVAYAGIMYLVATTVGMLGCVLVWLGRIVFDTVAIWIMCIGVINKGTTHGR